MQPEWNRTAYRRAGIAIAPVHDRLSCGPFGRALHNPFDDQDISPHGNHNIHIFDGGGSSFVGDITPHGTSITYEVSAFEAGTYQLQCDAHPPMNSAFIVK